MMQVLMPLVTSTWTEHRQQLYTCAETLQEAGHNPHQGIDHVHIMRIAAIYLQPNPQKALSKIPAASNGPRNCFFSCACHPIGHGSTQHQWNSHALLDPFAADQLLLGSAHQHPAILLLRAVAKRHYSFAVAAAVAAPAMEAPPLVPSQ